MNSLISYFAKQHLFVNVLTIFVFVVGIVSLIFLKREAFPDVSLDEVTVTTVYANTSARTIETLITAPLESDLGDVEGVKVSHLILLKGEVRLLSKSTLIKPLLMKSNQMFKIL